MYSREFIWYITDLKLKIIRQLKDLLEAKYIINERYRIEFDLYPVYFFYTVNITG